MTLVTYRPRDAFDRLSRDFVRAFSNELPNLWEGFQPSVAESNWKPAVDIKEEESRYLVIADIPGVDPKNIEVTFSNGILTISGERSSETESENKGYKQIERSYGSFSRQFVLPDSVDADNISAAGKNGVLEITIPKVKNAKARKIEVQ